MFGVGMPELVVILVVALIVLGPSRLPEVAKVLGKALAEFRRATSGFSEELDNARWMLEEETRKALREEPDRKSVAPPEAPPAAPVEAAASDPKPPTASQA